MGFAMVMGKNLWGRNSGRETRGRNYKVGGGGVEGWVGGGVVRVEGCGGTEVG